MEFKKAERKKIKLKIALIGPSGAGKTYSALRLAKGMSDKIAMIDTENKRAEIYANEFDFDVLNIDAPYTPEKYIEAIELAGKAGYEVLIIDSMSHEWIGKGGILEISSKMPDKNDFTKWAKLTPRHEAFITAITMSDMHIICTLRGKDEYVVEENDKGKKAPRKIGVGSKQRDGFEYECTVSLLVDQEKHVATVMKDNTHIFENRYESLTEEHGKMLLEWATQGKDEVKKISTEQAKKLCAIAGKENELAKLVIGEFNYYSSTDISVADYDKICNRLKEVIEADKKLNQEQEAV